jgi:hypothetical protein
MGMPFREEKRRTARQVTSAGVCLGVGVWLLATAPTSAFAQGTSGPTVSDTRVGYIDDAIPGNIFRFRYDATYGNRRPSRAEFFYAKTGTNAPGLPLPEPSVDFQDLSAYAELAFLPRLSAFVDIPTRFLNPEVNANAAGLADINTGFKWAMLESDTGVLTFQFRTYIPTGDASLGLGTHHVSLEPGLLFYQALGERVALEGELRNVVPVGGTEFAGDVIRYGLGVHYDVLRRSATYVAPVAEFVGWTALGGKESVVNPSGLNDIRSAAGDTMIHAKIGVRVGLGERVDFYGGYGRPLTGERWYDNTFRFELRIRY